MKSTFSSLFVVSFIILLGCNHKAESIKETELKTPCEFVNAINILVTEAEKLKGNHSIKELSVDEKIRYDYLYKKFWGINKILRSDKFDFKDEDFINCKGAKEMKKRIYSVEFD